MVRQQLFRKTEMTTEILHSNAFANPFADIVRAGTPALRYRGVAHEAAAPAKAVPGAPVTLVYRGVGFLRFPCRPNRTFEAEPGMLRYRGVAH